MILLRLLLVISSRYHQCNYSPLRVFLFWLLEGFCHCETSVFCWSWQSAWFKIDQETFNPHLTYHVCGRLLPEKQRGQVR